MIFITTFFLVFGLFLMFCPVIVNPIIFITRVILENMAITVWIFIIAYMAIWLFRSKYPKVKRMVRKVNLAAIIVGILFIFKDYIMKFNYCTMSNFGFGIGLILTLSALVLMYEIKERNKNRK